VGLRHLEKAAKLLSSSLSDPVIQVQYEWEPFLLNPNMADEGEDIMEHLTKKYGPSAAQRFASPDSPLMTMGRAVGIQFTTKRNAYPTLKAHALMEHIKQQQEQEQQQQQQTSTSGGDNNKANIFMEEMYKSYFERGENINNVETLAEIAAKTIGMDKEQVYEACSNHDLLRQVRQKDLDYKTRRGGGGGISGVPFFFIHSNNGNKPDVGLSGAQPPEVLAHQIQKAAV
jgi:predicted DsbA family dithiol-disulfide isomerase